MKIITCEKQANEQTKFLEGMTDHIQFYWKMV